ncbi:phosphoribosyltransferase [Candidatus Woesearchaeota archaeon]|nr:phosphoribosyltransferase [Candidatus Woesearchaeota archaeon]
MFKDRFEAGKLLAGKLKEYAGKKNVLVLAIPRGGLQIGYEVAKRLHVPLDVVITKKIGYPGNEEYAIGAVGPDGEAYLTEEVVSHEYIEEQKKELLKKIRERYRKYRGTEKLPDLKNKILILVDDGLATGSTMMAAVQYALRQKPAFIVLAVPVTPPAAVEKFRNKVDKIICLETPEIFFAVGEFYENFPQVEDEEAIRLLKEANA